MTSYDSEQQTCALCGQENDVMVVASTNTFGAPDLDTRPPQMQRATIATWVHRCRGCGYCAVDLGRRDPGCEVVESEAYCNQLIDPTYPVLANTFLCRAMIANAAGDDAASVWSSIRAAWASDDANQFDAAVVCRSNAADKILCMIDRGLSLMSDIGTSQVILVDVLRRCGRFEDAAKVLSKNDPSFTPDIQRIRAYEARLLEKRDTVAHTVGAALAD